MDSEFRQYQRKLGRDEHHCVVAADKGELVARFIPNVVAENRVAVSIDHADFVALTCSASVSTLGATSNVRLRPPSMTLICLCPMVDVTDG